MRIVIPILILLLVGGCATEPEIRYVPEIVEVEIPVAVQCYTAIPNRPVYATSDLTIDSTDFEKIQALLIERRQRESFETTIELLLKACSEP